jgi:hypothetical protein
LDIAARHVEMLSATATFLQVQSARRSPQEQDNGRAARDEGRGERDHRSGARIAICLALLNDAKAR